MKEIWKDIKGYEGLYQVSNLGRIKSLKNDNIKYGHYKEFIISQNNNNSFNYWRCGLCKNGVVKKYAIHRLVAEAFISNPYNLPQVNHIDGNKSNNTINNLEWVTCSENIQHSFKLGLHKPTMLNKKYEKNPNSKPIIQYDKNMNKIKIWNSITEASDYLKINKVGISYSCNQKRKTAGGYIWRFKEE